MNDVHGWFSDNKVWIEFIVATVVLWLLLSRKKRCAAGMTLLRGAVMPTNDQVRAGDQPNGVI